MKKNNITRKELAVSVTEKLGVSQRNAAEIVDTVCSTLKSTLINEKLSNWFILAVSLFGKNYRVEEEIRRQENL
jgi:hypothetical protein